METKLKQLEKITKEGRKNPNNNIFKEKKKISLLSSIKINNKTSIPNFQNINKNLTFPQISNEWPPHSIYNQIPIYYNSLMQQDLDYTTESKIMAFHPQEFVNIWQTQEKINLFSRIANAISEDSSGNIVLRLTTLILLTYLYDFYI